MQIKTLTCLIFLSAALSSFNTSGQTWYWTRQADSSNSQTASQVTVDRNNNPYYTGYCNGTRIAFGNIGLNITGTLDDFLVKYNTNGTPLWARNAKALANGASIEGTSVATDRNNNVLEAGYFSDSLAFGPYHLTARTASQNTYLVKYDGNGNLLWATAAKLPHNIYNNDCLSVTADKFNNIFITGYFKDTVIFGKDTLSAKGTDMFLVKYNAAGQVLWARAPVLRRNASSTYGLSVAADDSGNAYVGGNITDTATFGVIKIGATGSASIYLAKYDSSGKAKWVINTTATPGQLLPTPVIIDKTNNVYLGGQFTNASITIGPSTITNISIDNASNAMLVKYDHNGNPIWATCADNISQAELNVIVESSVAADRCNNVYWSGLCSDSFGVGKVKVTVPGGAINQSTPFAYVIKLDSNGNPIAGAAMANQNGNSFSNYLAVDSLSKALFASELVAPATLIVGSDTVKRYLSNSTCFLSKFAVIPPIILGNKHNDSICLGDSTLLQVASNPGTTYKWSNGATTDSIYVKPIITTNYYVTITTPCISDTSFITVTVIPPPKPIITGRDSICPFAKDTLRVTGGNSYVWSNGATTTSISVVPPSTTTYTVTAFNGGCSHDTTFTLHTVSPSPVITPSKDSTCSGDTIKLTASGGTSYTWSTHSSSNPIIVSPVVPTTYTLYATRGKCTDSAMITLGIIKPITSTSVTAVPDSICSGGSATLSVTASGGPAVSYLWNTGATTSTINVNPLITTTYTATVYGKCDTIKNTVKVTIVPVPKPIITGRDSVCPSSTDTLRVTGGTRYVWSNGATTTSIFVVPVSNTTYTVTAYNAGCSHDTTFTLHTVSPTPLITPSKDSTCSGDTIKLSASGGTTYSWSTNSTANTIIVKPIVPTTYTLYATRGTCRDSATVTLGIIKPVNSSVIAVPDSICPGQSSILSVTASGGPALKYKWNTGATNSSISVFPTLTTTYTATIYGKCDTMSRPVTVTVVPFPKPVIKGTPMVCKGIKDTLTVSGGAAYKWSSGNTSTSYKTGPINADSIITVTAYNALHCQHDTTFTIFVRPLPGIFIAPPDTACPGNNVILSVTDTGMGPFTYKWLPGGQTTESITVNPLSTTNYTLTVSNGCKASKTITVTPDNPSMGACCDKVILFGDDTIITASGKTIKTYSWSPSTGLNCDTCPTVIATPTVTTTYTVTGTDAYGCTVEKVITITVEIPCFNFVVPNVFTPNGDKVNDMLEITTKNLTSWSMLIYDRWGKEVFKTTNQYQFWDGTTEGGGQASDGVYYYIINATCQGNTYKKDGFVQLIR